MQNNSVVAKIGRNTTLWWDRAQNVLMVRAKKNSTFFPLDTVSMVDMQTNFKHDACTRTANLDMNIPLTNYKHYSYNLSDS